MKIYRAVAERVRQVYDIICYTAAYKKNLILHFEVSAL